MKRGILCVAVAAGAVAVVSAQQGGAGGMVATARVATDDQIQGTISVRPRMGLESRITKGAPYSGEAVNQFVQTLSDGNRITRKSVTKTYRDSEGRTRREQTITNWTNGTETTTIMIGDPVAGLSFVLEPETRTAYRETQVLTRAVPPTDVPAGAGARGGGGGRTVATVRSYGPDGSVVTLMTPDTPAGGRGGAGVKVPDPGATTEQLGQKTIEGVLAEGTRTTTIIPAGAIGNEQPIQVISEQWFSPDLQVLVSTRHSDPRSGETVYRLVNIVRGEQDRALFEVPADYTIKESRARQPMMKQPQ
jgi:hypothetical protein